LAQYLEQNEEQSLQALQEFLRQPCVPSEGLGMTESADLFMQHLEELGCQQVEKIEILGAAPGVWGRLDSGARATLVNYCMLDTKPARPEGWSVPPFGAEMVEREPFGRVVVARGSQGRKGPLMAYLNALKAWRAVEGELPVNLMFLAETEENLGSPNYRRFVEIYRNQLAEGDACFCPGMVQSADGSVRLTLGHKGMICLRLTASGKSSGFGPQERPAAWPAIWDPVPGRKRCPV